MLPMAGMDQPSPEGTAGGSSFFGMQQQGAYDDALSAELLQQLLCVAGAGATAAPAPGNPQPGGSHPLSLQAQQAALSHSSGQMGSGQWMQVHGAPVQVVPPSALSLSQVQSMQAQLSQLQSSSLSLPLSSGSLSLTAGTSMSLPLMPVPEQQQPGAQGRGAAAAKGAKPKSRRLYKPPEQVAAERKQNAEVQDHIRKLEQQLGRARKELEHLQQENKVLHRKAVVLCKHSSFRRSAAVIAQELTQSMTMSTMDWSQQASSQRVLDAAQRGLPGPEVLEQLRSMGVEQAVQYYNGVVARVRELLQLMDDGGDRAAAKQELESMLALQGSSTFGYLQVVNPEVFAQLMDTKLDASSPVERSDPTHWRGVLASMLLTEEQEAQLIMLLQSHLQQAEQVVQQKSRAMQQLADELTTGMLTLGLSGSSELSESDLSTSASVASTDVDGALQRVLSGQPSSPGPLQAKDELDRLIQLEYWLKYDFTGCVRKLLPAQQQALCMVSSWPFYPDQRQLEAVIKEKAGHLWEQLRRTASS